MNQWLQILVSALKRHGPRKFVRIALYNVYYHVKRIGSKQHDTSKDELDKRYGTNTDGIREVGTLNQTVGEVRHATRYEPSSALTVHQEIDGLGIVADRFSFIDFGSGKGRALLVAAEFPFRDVIGIEFSGELHEIARANLEKLPAALRVGGRVRSLHANVLDAELPAENLVCYFYNPFGEPVVNQVAKRLIEHIKKGYRVIVIYVEARHGKVFENADAFFVRKNESNTLVVDSAR